MDSTNASNVLNFLKVSPLTPVVSSCVVVVNLLMLLVIVINRTLLKTISPFIASLAFADLIVGLTMVLNYFRIGAQLLTTLGITASVSHIMVIAVDRCVSVMAAMTYQATVTNRIISVIILILWLVIFAVTCVPAIINDTADTVTPMKLELQLGVFGVETAFIIGLYAYLGAVALRHHHAIRRQVAAFTNQDKPCIPKASRVLLIILAAYLVLWTPYFACLVFILCDREDLLSDLVLEFVLVLGISNSGVNIFVYVVMNSQFRSAVVQLFKCKRMNDRDLA